MKALFVGLGSIGQRHLRNILKLRPGIEILAIEPSHSIPILSDDSHIITGVNVAQRYCITEFKSLDDALFQRPDLVFVTNPSSMHLESAAKALASGAFVFIEKPLSHDWKGVEDLLKAENAFGTKRIVVGFQFRFHPAMKMIAAFLANNHIGQLIGAQLTYGEYLPNWHVYEDYRYSYAARKELGGGALITLIHHFDNALWLFGRPKKIFAIGGQLSTLEINVEDSVKVLMSCEHVNRLLPVSISLDYLQSPANNSLSLVGEEGRIDCDLITNVVTVNNRLKGTIKRHEFEGFTRNEMFLAELSNFLSFAAGEAEPAVCLSDGMDSLKIALAARNSLELQSDITLTWS